MRAFEIAVVLLSLAGLAAIGPFSRGSSGADRVGLRRLFGALLILALAAHLRWERAHWQMAPAYLGAALTLLLLMLPRLSRAWKLAACAAILLLAVASCGLSYAFPMFRLPEPTGPFATGTRILTMTDASRGESADPDGGRRRELVVQVWYPALPSRNAYAPYRRRAETSLASSYQSVDWTNSRYDAPVASAPGGFPILLYNPGWNGRRTQNTPLAEELASRGYVVAAIDHPYNSGPVALGDGRVIRPVPTPELSDDATTEEALYAVINREVEKETEDTLFVLQQIERMNGDKGSPFYGRLDSTRIGTLGFSLGGLVAAEAAWRDPSIGAVLVLDTPLYGNAGKFGVAQPFMLICGDQTRTTPEQRARMSAGERRDRKMDEQDYDRQLPLLRRPGDYQIELHGATHSSFQDAAMTSPIRSISQPGAIAPPRMIAILRQLSVAFFDQSLRGIPSPLLNSRSNPFPEAQWLFQSSPRPPQADAR